ncbi:variable large family protein [Borrelia venezuelensis]|uniref:variable large family protein n=1 Tax=Borrelia venezuelensis TaxID=1653839 RepID=UPI001FF1F523|nr:variable large family protein [Borrelia venezuelensis]
MRKFNISILMILFLLMSCGSGQLQAEKLALESKNTFFDSIVKIGQRFYEIFGIFDNAIGDALGLTAVKSDDKRSKVGEHFKTIGDGLTTTKNKLNELSGEISEAKNANSSTIEAVKNAIISASDVFEQLISALIKLADVTKDDSPIGDTASAASAVAADKPSVDAIIKEVKAIIDAAKKSGIEIKSGTAGNAVNAAAASAPAAIGSNNAGQGAGDKLAAEVAKADPWAMIEKMKNSTTDTAVLAGNDKDAGTLATGTPADANGAKAATNANLAAALALKAMTKTGKFTAKHDDATEVAIVKAVAVSAVNKVLGVLDFIIRKTVSSNLDKIREAVKGIKYSETITEASTTTQPAATK